MIKILSKIQLHVCYMCWNCDLPANSLVSKGKGWNRVETPRTIPFAQVSNRKGWKDPRTISTSLIDVGPLLWSDNIGERSHKDRN